MVELRPELNSIYTGALQGGEKKSSLVSVADVKMRMVDVKMNLVSFISPNLYNFISKTIFFRTPPLQSTMGLQMSRLTIKLIRKDFIQFFFVI